MPPPKRYPKKPMGPRVRKNEQIHAQEVRVIDEKGENLGTLSTSKAIGLAKEKGLDLVEISAKAQPPVTRIIDYGKYLYRLDKKDRRKKQAPANIMKGVRIGMTTSEHDLLTKSKTVDKFLKKGYKVRVELMMKGREKGLQDMANQKIKQFLSALEQEHKIEEEPRRTPRGLQLMISSR